MQFLTQNCINGVVIKYKKSYGGQSKYSTSNKKGQLKYMIFKYILLFAQREKRNFVQGDGGGRGYNALRRCISSPLTPPRAAYHEPRKGFYITRKAHITNASRSISRPRRGLYHGRFVNRPYNRNRIPSVGEDIILPPLPFCILHFAFCIPIFLGQI